ncbi:MAG: hypothetical protein CM15mP59_5490 [Flavobacteriaceae bacterium]|nr:MAG: hypothetical protein CM15mP59_5490 [Flavobacteriaceae bacterium]
MSASLQQHGTVCLIQVLEDLKVKRCLRAWALIIELQICLPMQHKKNVTPIDGSVMGTPNPRCSFQIFKPRSLKGNPGIEKLNLFVNGENLLTFSEWRGFDLLLVLATIIKPPRQFQLIKCNFLIFKKKKNFLKLFTLLFKQYLVLKIY